MTAVLETDRLKLRELTAADAPFILQLLNEPLFLRFVGDRGVRTVEAARTYLEQGPLTSYAKHGFGLWHVAVKTSDESIGICGLLKRDVLEHVDVGFAFLPQFSGKGYATEAAAATLRYGYERLNLARIVAITAPDNTASQNVLGKIGLRHTQTIRLPGYQGDSFLFTPAA